MTGREQAIRFAELLFAARPDGSLIAVSIAPAWDKPHCVRAPADVADYAVGTGDVYVRHSPITRRPPKGKRGDERLTAALLGIVQDIDVNGSPDGRGGTVAGACPDRDAALELAHALLEPTLTVNSGFGVQAFHLLDPPFLIGNDDDLEAARALTFGWAERMKRIAGELGMAKLDTVGDLARVVRVPGSFNTKGATPVPVELLDDGGPRHPLERLRSFAATNGRPKPKPAARAEHERARDLLDRYPALEKIAKHRGTKPGDGSASVWDWQLVCRGAELELDDDDLAALLHEHRSRFTEPDKRDKAKRWDYVPRTIRKVRAKVGYPAHDPDAILPRITDLMQVDQVGLTLVDAWVSGDGGDAVVKYVFDDESVMRFARLGHVTKPDRLTAELSAALGVTADISATNAKTIASLTRRYVGRATELSSESLARSWVLGALRRGEDLPFGGGPAEGLGEQERRWTVWQELKTKDPSVQAGRTSPDTYAAEMLVPRDVDTGERFLRASWLQELFRRHGFKEGPNDLVPLALAIGLQRRGKHGRIRATKPEGEGEEIFAFYVVPPDWEDTHEVPDTDAHDGA